MNHYSGMEDQGWKWMDNKGINYADSKEALPKPDPVDVLDVGVSFYALLSLVNKETACFLTTCSGNFDSIHAQSEVCICISNQLSEEAWDPGLQVTF